MLGYGAPCRPQELCDEDGERQRRAEQPTAIGRNTITKPDTNQRGLSPLSIPFKIQVNKTQQIQYIKLDF